MRLIDDSQVMCVNSRNIFPFASSYRVPKIPALHFIGRFDQHEPFRVFLNIWAKETEALISLFSRTVLRNPTYLNTLPFCLIAFAQFTLVIVLIIVLFETAKN